MVRGLLPNLLEDFMSNSTNKSIADHEQTKSHHQIDEERHGTQRQEPDERGRKVEKEVAKRAKK